MSEAVTLRCDLVELDAGLVRIDPIAQVSPQRLLPLLSDLLIECFSISSSRILN